MADTPYPTPPSESLADLDPETATTDQMVAMAHAHRAGEDYPTGETVLANLPVVLRALCDHLLSGEATALEVAYRLAPIIDAYTIMATFSPFCTSAQAVGPGVSEPGRVAVALPAGRLPEKKHVDAPLPAPARRLGVHEGHPAPVGPRLHPRRNAGLAFQQEVVGDRFGQ